MTVIQDHKRYPWPLSMTMTTIHDCYPRPWLLSMTMTIIQDHDHYPWRSSMTTTIIDNHDRYLRPWPLSTTMTIIYDHNHYPWPLSMTMTVIQDHNHYPWPRPLSMTVFQDHDRYPWPLSKTMTVIYDHDHYPWPLSKTITIIHDHDHYPWPLSKTITIIHDHNHYPWPFSKTMTVIHDRYPRPWPLSMTMTVIYDHDRYPWPLSMTMTIIHDRYPRPWPTLTSCPARKTSSTLRLLRISSLSQTARWFTSSFSCSRRSWRSSTSSRRWLACAEAQTTLDTASSSSVRRDTSALSRSLSCLSSPTLPRSVDTVCSVSGPILDFFLQLTQTQIRTCNLPITVVHSTTQKLVQLVRNCLIIIWRRSFSVAAPMVWNSFPDSLRDPTLSIDNFRSTLKTHLFAAQRDT